MTTRPYSVMVAPHGATIAYEPMLTRASMEAVGWAFLADFPGYHPAAERAADFDKLPAVERWWAASWSARAGRESDV